MLDQVRKDLLPKKNCNPWSKVGCITIDSLANPNILATSPVRPLVYSALQSSAVLLK